MAETESKGFVPHKEEPAPAVGDWSHWKWSSSHNDRLANLLRSGFRSDFTLFLGPARVGVRHLFAKSQNISIDFEFNS